MSKKEVAVPKLTDEQELAIINKSDRTRAIYDIEELTPLAVPKDISNKVLDDYFIEVEESCAIQEEKKKIAYRIITDEWVKRMNTHDGLMQFLDAYKGYEFDAEEEIHMYCGTKHFAFTSTPTETLKRFLESGNNLICKKAPGGKGSKTVSVLTFAIFRRKIRVMFK